MYIARAREKTQAQEDVKVCQLNKGIAQTFSPNCSGYYTGNTTPLKFKSEGNDLKHHQK